MELDEGAALAADIECCDEIDLDEQRFGGAGFDDPVCSDVVTAISGDPSAARDDLKVAPEDSGLASVSLPTSTIRRIARSAVPGVKFSSEAISGLHRIAQAYVCFATDRSIAELQVDIDKANKIKGKLRPVVKKQVTPEHVMRFLSTEMPPIASKLSTLFPNLVPADFRPTGVRLLEQLAEQEQAATGAVSAGAGELGGVLPHVTSTDDDGARSSTVSETTGAGTKRLMFPPKFEEVTKKKRSKTEKTGATGSLTSFFGQPASRG